MIELNNISKSFEDKLLFKNFNLKIYDGEKIGIVGENGTGKSTLLNIISKELPPDMGSININENLTYVRQLENFDDTFLEKALKNVNYSTLFKLLNEFNLNDSFITENRISSLSGGEKIKLLLSIAFSNPNNIILLDEPTNNLDKLGIDFLIKKVNEYDGTILIVSHDRYFLNETVNKILEIENGKIAEFYGNYDEYYKQKQQTLLSQEKLYENQEKLETKLNKQINEIKQKAQQLEKNNHRDGSSDRRCKGFKGGMSNKIAKLSNAAKAKITRLNQLKENFIDRPYKSGEIYYKINESTYTPKLLIKAENLSKSFGNSLLFKNVSFNVNSGDKIALIGNNASGKTTLIKILLDLESFDGNMWKSPSIKAAYLSQDIFTETTDQTVMEIASKFDSFYKTKFLTNLANMNMTKQTFYRKITSLSQGERLKVKLNEIILSDYNLLILDEPTNNLDILNKTFLEEVLSNYKGTIILVSHDKQFIENICNKFLKIENKTLIKIS